LSEGNTRADQLVAPAWPNVKPDAFAQEKASHQFFHQSAKMLAHQHGLPLTDVVGIVRSCPDCQQHGVGIGAGVNPRGLQALQLWQMDVTHVSVFGVKRY
ncbi:POK19 protein, partial [Melanocharis versteri]|nr:POK19 protein [Melanocharis versteri]